MVSKAVGNFSGDEVTWQCNAKAEAEPPLEGVCALSVASPR
jgi:hypothetical protein